MYLSRPNETLEEHIDKVLSNYNYLCKYKNIDDKIKNIIKTLCKENIQFKECEDIIYEMFISSIKLHDEGKKNPYFQSYIRNEEFKDYKWNDNNKRHSLISSIYYLSEVNKLINNKIKSLIKRKNLLDIAYFFAYIISKHHSELDNFNKEDMINKMNLILENYP